MAVHYAVDSFGIVPCVFSVYSVFVRCALCLYFLHVLLFL